MRFQPALLKTIGVAIVLWGTAFSESEPNDIPNTANSLAVNIAGGGRLGDSLAPYTWDTYDWYSVTTPADGKLTIKTSTTGGLDIQPYIYRAVYDMTVSNPGGDWLGPAGDAVNDSVSDFLRAGTIYVQVIRRAGTGSYSITAQFTQAALANDAEMNDTSKLAMTLDANGSKTGHLGYYSTPLQYDIYDWYKVMVPADGRLVITTETSGGNLDLQPYIYRAVYDTNSINPGGDWTSPTGDSIHDTVSNALHAGLVWIQVIRRSGVGSYSIKSVFTAAALTNDTEINDTPRVAQTITMNTPFTGHMGYYSYKMGTDYYDWFKFTIPDEGKVTITSLTGDGNLDLHFYIYRAVYDSSNPNSGGDYVGSHGDSLADTAVDYLRAGTYYLQVIRSSGTGSYTIVPTFQQALYTADVEPNNTPAQAIALGYDSVKTGRIGYYSYSTNIDSYDWYSVTVPAACTLKVKTVTTGGLLTHLWIYSIVSDMNATNPGGTYVSGSGNGTNDTASVYAVTGTTYYVQIVRSSGIGSYIIAAGTANPVVSVINQKPSGPPKIENPDARLNYGLNNAIPVLIRVFDLRGRVILTQTIMTKQYSTVHKLINTNSLKKGLYVLEVTSNGIRNISRLQILR